MVVRRWADDGRIEVLDEPRDRVLEVAELLGLPVLSRQRFEGAGERYPWLGQPGRLLAPVPGAGGPVLVPRVGGGARPAAAEPSSMGERLLSRLWVCPERDCAAFGASRTVRHQPPPTLRSSAPTCPRHGQRLRDAGQRPRAEVLSARVGGVVRQRFVVEADEPVTVGRAPEHGVMLGQWLEDEARRWISRNHVRLELRGADLVAQDVSTNGTGVRPGGSMDDDERVALKGSGRVLGPGDVVELFPGVEVARARTWSSGGVVNPTSVMAEAPTMAMRVFER
jgi:hypothetical protein